MNAMNRWKPVALAALLGLTLALPAAAQWKWRDASGRTQYSDLPPPLGVPEQDILLRPSGSASTRRALPVAVPASSASAAPLAASRASDPELEARRKKAEQEVADKKKAEDDKLAGVKAENCTRAKAQMRTLDSGIRMARTNDKGEREFLDDNQRATEAKRTRDAIASECK
jgi:Domain of unknown function (DUF4124)